MSMTKIISNDSYDFNEPMAQLVKMSSRGLVGHDRDMFIKRASASFIDKLRHIKVAQDEALVHLIAVGATERYGCNRNGDGFRADVCRDHHDSFVKHAKCYRDHANKNPNKSFGIVKASAFNEPMQRIELLVAYNKTKEAADRNHGYIATRELEKLANDKPLSVSMACRIPYDVCSYCSNQAKNIKEYCTSTDQGGMCKAGGLSHNMGAMVNVDGDLHQLHADNPNPKFFDISDVFRPADRIAFASGLVKAASGNPDEIISGAALAEALGVSLPYDLLLSETDYPANVQESMKIAYILADLEEDLAAGQMPIHDTHLGYAFCPAVQGSMADPPASYQAYLGQFLKAAADEGICFSLRQFLALTCDAPREKLAVISDIVSREVPGIYINMTKRADFANLIANNPYTPAVSAAQPFRLWAAKHASSLSIQDQHVDRRVKQAAIRNVDVDIQLAQELTKTASTQSDQAVALATQYALYKLAFLTSTKKSQLTQTAALVQNYTQVV